MFFPGFPAVEFLTPNTTGWPVRVDQFPKKKLSQEPPVILRTFQKLSAAGRRQESDPTPTASSKFAKCTLYSNLGISLIKCLAIHLQE